jgi:TrmH family RNA methyltransferase
VITSTSNPRVRAAAALARRRERVASGLFLIDGPNAVADALSDGIVEELYCTEDEWPVWQGLAVEPTLVSQHVLEKIATSRTPQGVVAVGRIEAARLDQLPPLGLVIACHSADDPGNVGTIVRCADSVGAAGVVLCEGSADPWGPKAVRAAAGSVTHLPIVHGVPTAELLEAGRARGIVVALDGAGDVDVDDVAVDRPVTLLAGSEAHGLPDAVLDSCDVVATLPMWGRSESLNLGAAVAVAAYSLTRRIRRVPTQA